MSHRLAAKITGVAGYVPPKVMTNADLEKIVETNDEWIVTRTGIRERHVVEKGTATSHMATEAARAVLAQTKTDPAEIDLIVLASVTPDMFFPATACLVQERIGAKKAWGFESGARCGQIEPPRLLRTDTFLHQAGRGREKHVGGNTGEHDQVDLRRIRPGLQQHGLCSFGGHVRGGHAILHDVAFADAGARADPFVICLDDFLEVGVGHHLRRNVGGYTHDFCRDGVGHGAPCKLLTCSRDSEFYAIAP